MTTINAQFNQEMNVTNTVFNALSAVRSFSMPSIRPAATFKKATSKLASFYSNLLGEKVTAHQSLTILHAKVAFLAMVFPMEMSVLYHVATVAWFAITLKKCHEAGL